MPSSPFLVSGESWADSGGLAGVGFGLGGLFVRRVQILGGAEATRGGSFDYLAESRPHPPIELDSCRQHRSDRQPASYNVESSSFCSATTTDDRGNRPSCVCSWPQDSWPGQCPRPCDHRTTDTRPTTDDVPVPRPWPMPGEPPQRLRPSGRPRTGQRCLEALRQSTSAGRDIRMDNRLTTEDLVLCLWVLG